VEVYVSWSIDEVELVLYSILSDVHLDRLELDSNPALSFQIHLVKELLFHLALLDGLGHL
jgi:hypothetical protein